MSLSYCFNPPHDLFRELLNSERILEWSSLWILPEKGRFSAEELRSIAEMFPERRLALWRLRKVATLSDGAMTQGKSPSIIDGLIAQCIFAPNPECHDNDQLRRGTQTLECGWFARDMFDFLAESLKRGHIGAMSSVFAFLVPETNQPIIWAKCLLSMVWHGRALDAMRYAGQYRQGDREQSIGLENLRLEHHLLAAYLFASSGAICCMKCEDSDTTPALVFWGSHDELQAASTLLPRNSNDIGAGGLKNWLSRGAMFSV
jgi:hypothetical protein